MVFTTSESRECFCNSKYSNLQTEYNTSCTEQLKTDGSTEIQLNTNKLELVKAFNINVPETLVSLPTMYKLPSDNFYCDTRENVDSYYSYSRRNNCNRLGINDISQNSYNRYNHEIHECIWCPCILYSLFICIIPALLYMHKSDKRYNENRLLKAKIYAYISSILFGVGIVFAVAIYALIAVFVYYINFVDKI